MQAILPILALSFYFSDGGDDDNNGNGMMDHDGDGAMTTAMAARAMAQRMTMDACMSGLDARRQRQPAAARWQEE